MGEDVARTTLFLFSIKQNIKTLNSMVIRIDATNVDTVNNFDIEQIRNCTVTVDLGDGIGTLSSIF